jgi:hypothetical protein
MQFVDGIHDGLPYRCERIVRGARGKYRRDEFVSRNCVAIVQPSQQLSREPERRTFHPGRVRRRTFPIFFPSLGSVRAPPQVCRKFGVRLTFV